MKKKFNDIARKTRLYAEQATVMTYVSNETEVTLTEGEHVISHEKHDAASVRAAILGALDGAQIPYALIVAEENVTTLAVARSKRQAAETAINAAPGIRLAISMSMSSEITDALAPVTNTLLKPFSPLRREVAKQVKRLGA